LHVIFDYICQDLNPSSDVQLGYYTNTQFDSSISLFLHAIIFVCIQIFKKSEVHNIQHGTQSGCPTNQYFQNIEKITLADFLTNFLLALWIGNLAFLQYKIRQLTLLEVNMFPYSFYLFGFQYYANSLSGLIISLVYFCRHPHLREKLYKELSEQFFM
jgi:hypothetical protein